MSESLPYRVVDVFTDRAYAGNPLAVVLDGDGLTTEQMQANPSASTVTLLASSRAVSAGLGFPKM
jgi:predicted PhzF superfamily epimerase YddE/YHI9